MPLPLPALLPLLWVTTTVPAARADDAPPAEPAPPATEPAAPTAPPTAAAAPAKGAARWDDADPDLRAEGFVPAPPEAVFAYALDLSHWPILFPSTCMGKIELGERTYGEGASAIVRYDMAMMHRKLPVTLTFANAPDRIDFDHLGNKGFLTRWRFTPENGGTRVSIHTPIYAPPKPLRGYYYQAVQPEWQSCYAAVLANLARVLGSAPSP